MPPPHQSSEKKSRVLYFIVFLFILVWFFLLVSVMDNNKETPKVQKSFSMVNNDANSLQNHEPIPLIRTVPKSSPSSMDFNKKLREPKRYETIEKYAPPAPMAEIERNMTLYLTTLNKRLTALAGPTVDAVVVWDTFMEVTRDMPMTWDEQNAFRFPKPRSDGSIFVSLGTYRDPFCPMTIKSLYKNAKHPDKVVVGMFQQNCFGPKCRTGLNLLHFH